MGTMTGACEAAQEASEPAPGPLVISDDEERRATEYEARIRQQQNQQFQRLKDEARAVYGMVNGRPGVISPKEWKALLDETGDDIGNGRFIVRYLGAERFLDAETVAVLISLRQNLIADLKRPKTADIMRIDTAIVAYYNLLRTQRWIGDTSLVFEAELFGQKSLSEIHGETIGLRLREELKRLSEVLMPLQERCHRMMTKSLDAL